MTELSIDINNLPGSTLRVGRIKERFLEITPEICVERAQLIKDSLACMARSSLRQGLVILVVVLSCITLSKAANAEISYSVTQIAEGEDVAVYGINNSGQVSGRSLADAFVWSKSEGLELIPKPPVPPGFIFVQGTGKDINDNGTVVGWYAVDGPSGGNFMAPFIHRRGQGTELLADIERDQGVANAVNNDDHVVGWLYEDGPSSGNKFPIYWLPRQGRYVRWIVADESGFIRELGETVDLRDTGGVRRSHPEGVVYPILQSFGRFLGGLQITEDLGWYWDGNGDPRDIEDKTEVQASENTGWNTDQTKTVAMNESGQIVGTGTMFSPPYTEPVTAPGFIGGFLYDLSTGTYTAIPWLPGGDAVLPLAINESGQVVGRANVVEQHANDGIENNAIVWSLSGGLRKLDDLIDPALGLHLTEAVGINDGGQIIAMTADFGEPRASYLLTPAHDLPSLRGMVEALCDTFVLNHGQCRSLLVKLEHAAIALGQGEIHAAQAALFAFENEVRAFLNAGILTPAQGHPLLVASEHIRSTLGVAGTGDGATLETQLG